MAKHLKIECAALDTPNTRTRLFKRRVIRKLKKEIALVRQAARMEATLRRELHLQ
jgi:hypothetical protein